MAAEQPDLYGIRRSERARKEVERFHAGDDSDSDESSQKRRGRRVTGRKNSRNSSNWDDSDSGSDADSSSARLRNTRRATRAQPARRAPTRKATRRNNSSSGSASSSSSSEDSYSSGEEERRTSTRRAPNTKQVSYKEASEEETGSEDLIEVEETDAVPQVIKNDAETIERVMKHRMGQRGNTGSRTTLYNQLYKQGSADEDPPIPEDAPMETQYLIKWKGWSHIHNTWESMATLNEQKVNGLKKMENYKRKMDDMNEWRSRANREDIEYFDCQEELVDDLNAKYCRVERIVKHTANRSSLSEFPDYLVKWEGLPYSECTYEDGQLITQHFKDALHNYNRRNKSQSIPTKICKVLKYRPKFVPLKSQPSFIGDGRGLELRDYQLDGLNWMLNSWCKNNSVILADEMGLGKTIQVISFINSLMNLHQLYGPFLVVVPLSTIASWQKEFALWAEDINVVVYLGDVSSRNMIREHEWCHLGNKRLKFNVLLTTYEILLKDKSFLGGVSWSFLGVDEAHRLKNDDSLLYKSLISFNTNMRMLITGTPLQNSLKELWSLLHFIMPSKFHKWEDFEHKHKSADKTGFRNLHQELEPFLLRRVKKDVEKSLPAKTEQILRVEMSNIQKQYYKWILTKNYKALSKGGRSNVSSFVNIVMELKKCCNHGHLVRNPDLSDPAFKGKDPLEVIVKILLDKLLMRLKESGHRVLIFSQMVRLLDILAEYLTMRRFQFQRLDGSIKGEVRKQAMEHFNAEGSDDFCFLLSTRAGGLGVNLATADTVIIFDSDWNPQNDLQAQARAHRIGQKKQVSVYRLVTKGSVEEDIVERAKKKMVLDHLVIQRMDTTGRTVLNRGGLSSQSGSSNPFSKQELNDILKFGTEELFKEVDDDENEVQVDIDEILSRAETRSMETDTNSATDELLSQFKVVSFDNLEAEELEGRDTPPKEGKSWDDIIPEVDRKRIEDEALQQQLMELNLPPRHRKQVQNMDAGSEDDRKSRRRRRDDSTEDSDEDSDDERPKRRGRPRAKGAVKGFSDAEVRRFIKSFKKFGRPRDRLDAISCDAELQEKSEHDLGRLADMLLSQCEVAMHEFEGKTAEEQAQEGGKKGRGPSFKLSGVPVNVKSLMQCINDLEPLAASVAQHKEEGKAFKFTYHTKDAHFDCDWDDDDDANLLLGVYEYGMGNWEAIKMDPKFNLNDKILPDGELLKPQAKHLQTRAEYLLKVLRKHTGVEEPKYKKRPPRSTAAGVKANPRVKSREIIDDNIDSDSESDQEKFKDKENREAKDSTSGAEEKKKKKKSEEKPRKDESSKKSKKKKSKKSQDGPQHFTTKETISLDKESKISDLPLDTFKQCKEKMRPVKKWLKLLDKPDAGLSDKEQVNHTRQCLLKIGDHINECLHHFNDPDVIKEWRSHLWNFVSKFTEFDSKRLYKLYKNAAKMRDESSGKDGKAEKKSKKRQADREAEGKAAKMRKMPDVHSDNSRDHAIGNGRHHSRDRPSNRDVREAVSQDSQDRWVHSSPLAREEDYAARKRYGGSAYSRPPGHFTGVGGTSSSKKFRSDRDDRSYSGSGFSRHGASGERFHRNSDHRSYKQRDNRSAYDSRDQDRNFHQRKGGGGWDYRKDRGHGHSPSSPMLHNDSSFSPASRAGHSFTSPQISQS
ncbi:hypothetical protein CAPTEDRAFT_167753 [Capitella teleta]|uniref:Uncharacterized protein n=1 Tax=Capitella teleta TaxID=283909 RepID=R7UXE9_CAPTE|nr:hypothetical protein CAPTEDRAFT_167753 [Capitella teleta]|eukprot:ELU11024.1 hypothetical protein CAPTEDRAFT_167753 [Capitella teleta]